MHTHSMFSLDISDNLAVLKTAPEIILAVNTFDSRDRFIETLLHVYNIERGFF